MGKIAAIIQARLGSSRLPNKVISDFNGKYLIEFLISRVKKCSDIDEIYLATTEQSEDDILIEVAKKLGINFSRGSKNDVLSRYIKTIKNSDADTIIRLTGDCPFLDPKLISEVIKDFKGKEVDYLSNCYPPTFPDGLDIEIFTRESLLISGEKCKNVFQREHVTIWIRESGEFKVGVYKYIEDLSKIRLTIDEPEDLIVARNIIKNFNGDNYFDWQEIIRLYKNKPNLFLKNKSFIRNEGMKMSSGEKLWRRAKRVIPGGNMLLSKRPEMFLSNGWPSYFSKSKGCKIWDLDGNEYIDMSIMGIGTNVLGYGNNNVDNAVRKVIENGNMSTPNCPEEVALAEKLVELHPWSDMVRFARSGGEANAIAVRIARAFSKKDKVAICGYHGWHDWYLATNLKDNLGLKDHLLPGLEPNGVPKGLEGTVIPFKYNDLDEIKNIVNNNEIGVIKMEVERSIPPNNGFLERIRKLCDENQIILIFDECTSGFRENFGGLHLKYNVEPDMAMFGKALGNGYAITAVIGKKEIMEEAQNTFISSTFWTERIGPTAALKTLEIMEDIKSWDQITKKGLYYKNKLQELASKYNLKLNITGLPALTTYTFESRNSLKYKTYITQEMLKENFLASNAFYASTCHSKEILDMFFQNLDTIFFKIKKCEEEDLKIDELLDFECCHSGFKRLN